MDLESLVLTRASTCLLALIICFSQPVLATGEPAATDIVFQEALSQTMASGQSWRYSNGDVYQGEWRNNRPHGQGHYQRMNGDDYTGLFHNGRFQGEGVCKYGNGDTYKGNWENGQPSGQGEMRYQNGNRYVGEWKAGNCFTAAVPTTRATGPKTKKPARASCSTATASATWATTPATIPMALGCRW